MNINSEDLKMIRKFQDIMSRGYYVDGTQLTEVYNRVLDKRVSPTNCSSCLRARTQELITAADNFERLSEKLSEPQAEQEPTPVKEEENKPVKSKKK